MQNSQHQGTWDRPAADLQAPGEENGECPREELTLIRPWGGLSPAPGEEGSVLGECRPELCPERGLLAVTQGYIPFPCSPILFPAASDVKQILKFMIEQRST